MYGCCCEQHGEQLGDHWQVSKLGFYRQSYEIPLIIRDPRPAADSSRGKRVEAFTEHCDIAPTLIEAVGGVPPPSMDGVSLLPFLHGDGSAPPTWRTAAHYEYDFRDVFHGGESGGVETVLGVTMHECGLAVLHGFKIDGTRYKYVHFSASHLPPVLFDLDNDEVELHNLAADPDYQGVLVQMMVTVFCDLLCAIVIVVSHLPIAFGHVAMTLMAPHWNVFVFMFMMRCLAYQHARLCRPKCFRGEWRMQTTRLRISQWIMERWSDQPALYKATAGPSFSSPGSKAPPNVDIHDCMLCDKLCDRTHGFGVSDDDSDATVLQYLVFTIMNSLHCAIAKASRRLVLTRVSMTEV